MLQVAATAHVRVEARFLDHGAALKQRRTRYALTEQPARPGRRPYQPGAHPQGGRLAGAVGAQEAGELAGRDLEIEVVNRETAGATLAGAFGLDGHNGAHFTAPAQFHRAL